MNRPPRFLFYQIYRGCNLRCTHCDFWKLEEHPDAQTIEELETTIAEFAALSELRGTVVTCGGEPTMAKEKYWALARACRQNGLRLFSVQNGTGIRTLEQAKRALLEGPHEITISLDGPDAEMHDAHRGVKGSFDKAVRALRLLVQARSELGLTDSRIYAMTIWCRSLAGRLDEFFDLVLRDIGADKLKLNLVMPTFNAPNREGHIDPYWEREQIADIDSQLAELAACDAKYGLNRNPVWIQQVRMYCKSLLVKRAQGSLLWSTVSETTSERVCNAMDRNIVFFDTGGMQLCFNGAFPRDQWRNFGDMHKFWYETSDAWRGEMRACKRLCGMSHSQRNSTSLL